MPEYLTIKLKSTAFRNLSDDDVNELIAGCESAPEAMLTQSPEVSRVKGDPTTFISFGIAIAVATMPILVEKIIDWQKARNFVEVTVEVEKGHRKAGATLNIAKEDDLTKTTKQFVQQIEDAL